MLLVQMLRTLVLLRLFFLIYAGGKDQSVSMKMRLGTSLKGRPVRLVLDPLLLPQLSSKSPSAIANMSLSPWKYKDSFMASRLPRRISEAECLTSGCLSLQDGEEDPALEAKPIKYELLVLHRVKRHGHTNKKWKRKYTFRLGTEVITVGCTCVRPTVILQE
ncbi:interleukin-17F-like [Pholidichthys leucotaenia]